MAFHLNKNGIPPSRDALCHDWLKLTQKYQELRWFQKYQELNVFLLTDTYLILLMEHLHVKFFTNSF